jgi:hypothetical protein
MTKRGSVALSSAVRPGSAAPCSASGDDPRHVARVQPHGHEPRVVQAVHDGPCAVEVVVGHHEALDEGAPHRDRRRRAPHPAGTHEEYAHCTTPVSRSTRYGENVTCGHLVGESLSCDKDPHEQCRPAGARRW